VSRLVAHGEESLVRLAGYVHDAWFDVRQIRQEGSVVSIPVALRGLRVPRARTARVGGGHVGGPPSRLPRGRVPARGKAEIVPHVTIGGRLTWEQQQEIRRELAPRLPVEARAERVVLVERGEDGRWFDREVFPL
jgi:hypothetical protein